MDLITIHSNPPNVGMDRGRAGLGREDREVVQAVLLWAAGNGVGAGGQPLVWIDLEMAGVIVTT